MNIEAENVHLFHIGYSDETVQLKEPGYALLDNRRNQRPDWYESWPIREYLKQVAFKEDSYYGFFSPKFKMKTGLGYADVLEQIVKSSPNVDAFVICPQPEVGAFFLNPFHGSEFTDKGALETAQEIFDLAQIPLNLESMIIDSALLSFSNYVVAKPAFWRRWLHVVDVIYAAADEEKFGPGIAEALCRITQYNDNAQRKVFLIENIASAVFAADHMEVKSIPIVDALTVKGVMYPFKREAQLCDALKIAARTYAAPHFLTAFYTTAQSVLVHFLRHDPKPSRQETPKIVLAVASRYSEEDFYAKSATGRSLKFFNFPFVEVCLFPQNTSGLPVVYNQAIEWHLADNCILVFAHDDLHIIDFFWVRQLYKGLESYDIVGIVGNRSRAPMQPSWAFLDVQGTWDKKEHLSGTIAHGNTFPPKQLAVFGSNGPVKILDGLLIAGSSRMFRESGLRYDERFMFHFYDLDFCRQAEALQLSMATLPISLIHESSGNFQNVAWLESYKAYIAKWGS